MSRRIRNNVPSRVIPALFTRISIGPMFLHAGDFANALLTVFEGADVEFDDGMNAGFAALNDSAAASLEA